MDIEINNYKNQEILEEGQLKKVNKRSNIYAKQNLQDSL